ncbi:MAG TPA: hypothetical protein VIM47_01075 [Dermatophilaceae bacterium]
MSTIEITAATKVTMLKQLVAGKDLEFVATTTRVPRDTVLDIVSNHGYPDHDRMGWAIDMLIQGGDSIPVRPADNHRGTPLDPAAVQAIARANAQSNGQRPNPRAPGYALTPPAPTGRPAHTSVSELLHQAGESDLARTRNLGAKISALLADLTERLVDEQEAHEAKVAAEKAAAAVAARIAVLQAEIAKLKRRPVRTTMVAGPGRSKTLPRNAHPGVHPCAVVGCARTFDTAQGAALHQRRAHEGYNPNAGPA